MFLNTIKPAEGSKKPPKRIGRGIGSGSGKTSGKGHKGQHARAGGFHKLGFEGGQMPMQRRLPKFGFTSKVNIHTAEIKLSTLVKHNLGEVSLAILKSHKLIRADVTKVKVINSPLDAAMIAMTLDGVFATKSVKSLIENAGGKVLNADA